MSIYVFLGPTLSVKEASGHCQATYLPPVEQGDVLRLLDSAPKAIGIIDGRFQFVPSVWHKELLAALSQGVHVFGSASMGALRAAETASYGMVGVGEVFEKYASGEIEDDDEVAVTHASAEHGYRETSDAMVNIRDACSAAVAQGVIPQATASTFVDVAKSLYFPERNWSRTFEIAADNGVTAGNIKAMNTFRRNHVPVKRRDAIALLKCMSQLNSNTPPFKPSFQLENTIFLDNLRTGLSHLDKPALTRKKVLLEILATEEAHRFGDLTNHSLAAGMSTWFRETYNLIDEHAFHSYLNSSGLTHTSFNAVMERFTALDRVQDRYRDKIDQAMPGHLAVMAAAKHNDRPPTGWSQWNASLSRLTATAPQNAAKTFAALSTTIDALKSSGALHQFYFMRKSPDIRLRFRGHPSKVDRAITSLLETAQQQGWLHHFTPGIYEPETALFGGEAAMELVHTYFDADTAVWLQSPSMSPAYSAALMHGLFMQTLNSSSEAWQLWSSMETVDIPAANYPANELLFEDQQLLPLHLKANQQLAAGLRELWTSGALKMDLRSVLSSVAMFHFNRYGIPGPLQAALAREMATHLQPAVLAGGIH